VSTYDKFDNLEDKEAELRFIECLAGAVSRGDDNYAKPFIERARLRHAAINVLTDEDSIQNESHE